MMSKMSRWIEEEKKYCANNYSPLPTVLKKAQGVWMWDIEDKRYLDMMSAYSAVSLGHAHPRIIQALSDQAQQLAVTSRAFHTNLLLPFLKKLCEFSGMDMALPMNTGVEAVETAIKAVRRWGYQKKNIPENKAEIIVANNNFHGRTTTVISFSSEPSYQKDFGPFTPGFVSIPFGDNDALRKAITPNTCALLIEPMQGEAGIIIPPQGWLNEAQAICQENNVLLVLDEVQTGLGRTGKMFAYEYEIDKPDGLILGKALGGGVLPVSAFLAKKEVMEVFTPGSHGSTFGGNALAARVGLETLHLLEEGDLVARSARLGKILLDGIQAIKSPVIKEVRGRGLWVGIDINENYASSRDICEALMESGILTKDVHNTAIRFAPPLIIEEDILHWAIEQLTNVVKKFAKG